MTAKHTINEHILHIRKAHEQNRLAVFVGAGFSKCANPQYPSWQEIIDDLKKAMPNIQETDFPKIAEHYQLEFGEVESKRKIQSYFPQRDIPYKLHKYLIELYPHYIITTNWDKIFEESLEETSVIYEIIVEDNDLPLSSLDYKLIKMHGDFDHNNYVFTESDYYNYSNNFPLIENYIKGIFTTHVILFLGYGFGDMDLKLILTWLKQNSEQSPSRYMFLESNSYSLYSENYYKNYNITLLPTIPEDKIKDETEKENKNEDIIKEIQKKYYFSQKDYRTFIEKINNEEFLLTVYSTEEYVYNQLKPLENLNAILCSQISSVLTNCNVKITQEGVFLHFHDKALTTDYNQEVRDKFKEFCINLNKNKSLNNTQIKIIAILRKALIDGIYYGDSLGENISHTFTEDSMLQMDMILNKILSFDYSFNDIYKMQDDVISLLHKTACYCNLGQYRDALEACEFAIKHTLKTKEYHYYLIALWNYNAILFELKNNNWEQIENSYANYKEKNLEKEYNRLPTHLRKQYKEIYEVLTFDNITLNYAISQKALNQLQDKVNLIKDGGITLSNEISLDTYKHHNIICFFLANNIMMEKVTEFKLTCQNYFNVAILSKNINMRGQIHLTYIEFYSAIRYFQNKDLENSLKTIYNDVNTGKILLILNINKDWLINEVLKNCTQNYITAKNLGAKENFLNYLCNILTIFKYHQIDATSLGVITEKMNEIVSSSGNLIQIFPAITNFYMTQHKLYFAGKGKTEEFPTEEMLNIVSSVLSKYVNSSANFYEIESITKNTFSPFYKIASCNKFKFHDKKLLEKVINKIKAKLESRETLKSPYDLIFNLNFSTVMQIYPIADKVCKEIIKNYIKEQYNTLFKNLEEIDIYLLEYELWLLQSNMITELKDKEGNEKLDVYIEYFTEKSKNQGFDSRWYGIKETLEAVKDMDSINKVLKEKLQELYDIIQPLVENYKPFGGFSSNV